MTDTEHKAYYLTPRERSVIVALAKTAGADAQVAATLDLSRGTVKVYLSRIREKLRVRGFNVESRYNFITWAKEHQAELESAE